MPSGKSKSEKNKFGIRKKCKKTDEKLAPRSLKRKGKYLLKECSEEELKSAGVIE